MKITKEYLETLTYSEIYKLSEMVDKNLKLRVNPIIETFLKHQAAKEVREKAVNKKMNNQNMFTRTPITVEEFIKERRKFAREIIRDFPEFADMPVDIPPILSYSSDLDT